MNRVEVRCPTVFQRLQTSDETIELCFFTKGRPARVSASAYAGDAPRPSERIRFDTLDSKTADVTASGDIMPIHIGQTTLRVAVESKPDVFGQMGIYVDSDLRFGRWSIWTQRQRDCSNPNAYSTTAYAWVPDPKVPLELRCINNSALSCLADGSNQFRLRGVASKGLINLWAEACCCATPELVERAKRMLPW